MLIRLRGLSYLLLERTKPHDPILKLGNEKVKISSEHNHLGMILDHNLDFQSHIREVILKARRDIGLITYLSKEVPDQVYKLYVIPHLDYGDIIYHRFDPEMHLEITKKLEQVHYSAPLAVTGTWRGTSRQNLELLLLNGLLNYYRKYIENFSKVAKPLFDLLQAPQQDSTSTKRNMKSMKSHTAKPSRKGQPQSKGLGAVSCQR